MVAPEIDARMNLANEAQVMRGQTSALLCEDLGLKISDSLLTLPSAQSRNAVQSGAVVSRQGCTYVALRPRDGEVFQRKGNLQKRGMLNTSCPSGAKLCRVCGRSKSRAMDLQRPIAKSCFAPAKRDMAATKGEWLEATGTVH